MANVTSTMQLEQATKRYVFSDKHSNGIGTVVFVHLV
jgi:hypothetical protein